VLIVHVVRVHLPVHEAVEDKDEEALERVEHREEVGDHHGVRAHVQEAERPCEPQQHHQHRRPLQPRPANQPPAPVITQPSQGLFQP